MKLALVDMLRFITNTESAEEVPVYIVRSINTLITVKERECHFTVECLREKHSSVYIMF